jgi:hypothetical protein
MFYSIYLGGNAVNRKKYIDKEGLIDAIEVGPDFVTVYINATEPGKPGSVQQDFIQEFKEFLEDPYLHDPERFHKGDHPRGSNWRTWEHKFACHFHLLGDPDIILNALIEKADLSDNLRGKLDEATTIRL